MRVLRAGDLCAAAARVTPFAVRDEARNCLQIEALSRALKRPGPGATYIAWVEHCGEVAGLAVRDGPTLLLSHGVVEGTVEALAEDVLAATPGLPAWTAPAETAAAFASAWRRLAGCESNALMRLSALRLDHRVVPPRFVPGEMRAFTEDDRELLVGWHRAATEEIGFLGGQVPGAALVQMLLEECQPFLWWDRGRPVSMAAAGQATPNGCRVHSVYTPPELRGRGYGINCMAALSQHLLDGGHRFCVFLAHPAVSAVYERIGYRPAGDLEFWMIA